MEEAKTNPNEPKKCPDCGGEIGSDGGEKYCKKCGLVMD